MGRMSRLKADLLILIAAAIWGLAFVFQKTAMGAVGPYTFIAARAVVAAIVLAPLAWFEANRATEAAPADFYRVVLWGGVAFFLGAAFQQVGLLTATVTNTGFLTALYVVIVPFLIWVSARQAPSTIVWIAAGLSFVGIWLLGGANLAAFNFGDGMVAICAVFWAVHVVVTGAAGRHARPVTFTCLQFCVVAAIALVAAFTLETVTVAGLKAAWFEIAYVGVLSSAVTFTLVSIALRHAPASEAAILMSSENLIAALAAAVLLGERLGLINWSGAALIVAAGLLIQLAPRGGKPI
jgi:drug/metabolite transporter (DMT)-like permease